MDEYVRNKSAVGCKRRKRCVELSISNSGAEKKSHRNTFLENGEKQRSKLRLGGPMSTIVEENISPQIREINQNVKELLNDITKQISRCDLRCDSNYTSVGVSTSAGSSQTDSNMSTTTNTSDPSATSHDVESLTFCSSRKSRSFHFTTSKHSSGDVVDLEVPRNAKHQKRRTRRHTTLVANVLTKKSLSNSDIYNQQYAVFPVHVDIPKLLRRNKVVKHTSSSSIKRKREALLKFRQPSVLSTLIHASVDDNHTDKQNELILNINQINSVQNCEEKQIKDGDKKDKKTAKKDKETNRNKSPEKHIERKRDQEDVDCDKHEKQRKEHESKSKHKVKKALPPLLPRKISPNSSVDDLEAKDEKNKKHKRKEKHEMKKKSPERKQSYEKRKKLKSPHRDMKDHQKHRVVSKDEIVGSKTPKQSPSRTKSPDKYKLDVFCNDVHKDHKHRDRGDITTRHECTRAMQTHRTDPESPNLKQVLDVDPKDKDKDKYKRKKRKEKEKDVIDDECGERKKTKRESSLVRIKHSLMHLAGFTKLGDRKRSKSKKGNNATEKAHSPLRARDFSLVRQDGHAHSPIAGFDVYKVNVKVKRSCNMQRFLEQDDADLANLCSCEYISYDKKPRPTITRAQLGSLQIPPFKPKHKKRESRRRHRRHHKAKEEHIKQHVDCGTMPQSVSQRFHQLDTCNKQTQDTYSKDESPGRDSSFKSTGCMAGDTEKATSKCSLQAQPTLGSVMSSYDSHETAAWDTSLTSLGEVSNLMIISELGSTDDRSGSFVSNDDVSKAIHHIVEQQSGSNDNHLKNLVEWLYVRPVFDRYSSFMMEPYCYMTLNTALNKRRIKNKGTNTDIVWNKDDLKIEYYSRAINKAKSHIPQLSKSRRTIFRRSYSNKLLALKRSRRFYQSNKHMEQAITMNDSQLKNADMQNLRSKIPVFFNDKRLSSALNKKVEYSSEASSFVDSGKSEIRKGMSRIPRPRQKSRSFNVNSPKYGPSDPFVRSQTQLDEIPPMDRRCSSTFQDSSFDLDSPILDALTRCKDIVNLDEEMIEFVYSDDSDSKSEFQSDSKISTIPDKKTWFCNIFTNDINKPSEIPTIVEENPSVVQKTAAENFREGSKHYQNVFTKSTLKQSKKLMKLDKNGIDGSSCKNEIVFSENRNDIKMSINRIFDSSYNLVEPIPNHDDSLKNSVETSYIKMYKIDEAEKLSNHDNVPQKDSWSTKPSTDIASDSLDTSKLYQMRSDEKANGDIRTNIGDTGFIKLGRNNGLDTNTTFIVNLADLDEQCNNNPCKCSSKSLIEDGLRVITSKMNVAGELKQCGDVSKHSVSLQVLMPTKHADTNTSWSSLGKYATKKSNWKSRLPLPINVDRHKLPVRNTYTFPIEIDLTRLNQSEGTAENVSSRQKSLCYQYRGWTNTGSTQVADHIDRFGQDINFQYFNNKFCIAGEKSPVRGFKANVCVRWCTDLYRKFLGKALSGGSIPYAHLYTKDKTNLKYGEKVDVVDVLNVQLCISSYVEVFMLHDIFVFDEQIKPVLKSLSDSSLKTTKIEAKTEHCFLVSNIYKAAIDVKQQDGALTSLTSSVTENVERLIAVTNIDTSNDTQIQLPAVDKPNDVTLKSDHDIMISKEQSSHVKRQKMLKKDTLSEPERDSSNIIFDVPALPKHSKLGVHESVRKLIEAAKPEITLDVNRKVREDVVKKLAEYEEKLMERERHNLITEEKHELDKQIKTLNKQAEKQRDVFHDIYTPITRCDYGMTYFNFKSALRNYIFETETLRMLTPCVKGHMQKAPQAVQLADPTPVLIPVVSQDCEKDVTTMIGEYIFPDFQTLHEVEENRTKVEEKKRHLVTLQAQNQFLFEIHPLFGVIDSETESEPSQIFEPETEKIDEAIQPESLPILEELSLIKPILLDASCFCTTFCICDAEDDDFTITLNMEPNYQEINVTFNDEEFTLILQELKSCVECCDCSDGETEIQDQTFFENLFDNLRLNGEFLRKIRNVLVYSMKELLGYGEYREIAREFIKDVMMAIIKYQNICYLDARKIHALEMKYRHLCIGSDYLIKKEQLETINEVDEPEVELVEDMMVAEKQIENIDPISLDNNCNCSVRLEETSFANLLSLHCCSSCNCMGKLSKSTSLNSLKSTKNSKSCICLSEDNAVREKRNKHENIRVEMACGDEIVTKKPVCQNKIIVKHYIHIKEVKPKYPAVELERFYNTCECFIPAPVVRYYYTCSEIVVRHPPILWVLAKKLLTRSNSRTCTGKVCKDKTSKSGNKPKKLRRKAQSRQELTNNNSKRRKEKKKRNNTKDKKEFKCSGSASCGNNEQDKKQTKRNEKNKLSASKSSDGLESRISEEDYSGDCENVCLTCIEQYSSQQSDSSEIPKKNTQEEKKKSKPMCCAKSKCKKKKQEQPKKNQQQNITSSDPDHDTRSSVQFKIQCPVCKLSSLIPHDNSLYSSSSNVSSMLKEYCKCETISTRRRSEPLITECKHHLSTMTSAVSCTKCSLPSTIESEENVREVKECCCGSSCPRLDASSSVTGLKRKWFGRKRYSSKKSDVTVVICKNKDDIESGTDVDAADSSKSTTRNSAKQSKKSKSKPGTTSETSEKQCSSCACSPDVIKSTHDHSKTMQSNADETTLHHSQPEKSHDSNSSKMHAGTDSLHKDSSTHETTTNSKSKSKESNSEKSAKKMPPEHTKSELTTTKYSKDAVSSKSISNAASHHDTPVSSKHSDVTTKDPKVSKTTRNSGHIVSLSAQAPSISDFEAEKGTWNNNEHKHNQVTIETMTINEVHPMISMTVLTEETLMKDQGSVTSSWTNHEIQTILSFKPTDSKRSSWFKKTLMAFRRAQSKTFASGISFTSFENLLPGVAQTSITLLPTLNFPHALFGGKKQKPATEGKVLKKCECKKGQQKQINEILPAPQSREATQPPKSNSSFVHISSPRTLSPIGSQVDDADLRSDSMISQTPDGNISPSTVSLHAVPSGGTKSHGSILSSKKSSIHQVSASRSEPIKKSPEITEVRAPLQELHPTPTIQKTPVKTESTAEVPSLKHSHQSIQHVEMSAAPHEKVPDDIPISSSSIKHDVPKHSPAETPKYPQSNEPPQERYNCCKPLKQHERKSRNSRGSRVSRQRSLQVDHDDIKLMTVEKLRESMKASILPGIDLNKLYLYAHYVQTDFTAQTAVNTTNSMTNYVKNPSITSKTVSLRSSVPTVHLFAEDSDNAIPTIDRADLGRSPGSAKVTETVTRTTDNPVTGLHSVSKNTQISEGGIRHLAVSDLKESIIAPDGQSTLMRQEHLVIDDHGDVDYKSILKEAGTNPETGSRILRTTKSMVHGDKAVETTKETSMNADAGTKVSRSAKAVTEHGVTTFEESVKQNNHDNASTSTRKMTIVNDINTGKRIEKVEETLKDPDTVISKSKIIKQDADVIEQHHHMKQTIHSPTSSRMLSVLSGKGKHNKDTPSSAPIVTIDIKGVVNTATGKGTEEIVEKEKWPDTGSKISKVTKTVISPGASVTTVVTKESNVNKDTHAKTKITTELVKDNLTGLSTETQKTKDEVHVTVIDDDERTSKTINPTFTDQATNPSTVTRMPSKANTAVLKKSNLKHSFANDDRAAQVSIVKHDTKSIQFPVLSHMANSKVFKNHSTQFEVMQSASSNESKPFMPYSVSQIVDSSNETGKDAASITVSKQLPTETHSTKAIDSAKTISSAPLSEDSRSMSAKRKLNETESTVSNKKTKGIPAFADLEMTCCKYNNVAKCIESAITIDKIKKEIEEKEPQSQIVVEEVVEDCCRRKNEKRKLIKQEQLKPTPETTTKILVIKEDSVPNCCRVPPQETISTKKIKKSKEVKQVVTSMMHIPDINDCCRIKLAAPSTQQPPIADSKIVVELETIEPYNCCKLTKPKEKRVASSKRTKSVPVIVPQESKQEATIISLTHKSPSAVLPQPRNICCKIEQDGTKQEPVQIEVTKSMHTPVNSNVSATIKKTPLCCQAKPPELKQETRKSRDRQQSPKPKAEYVFADCCNDDVKANFYKFGEKKFKKEYPQCCWPTLKIESIMQLVEVKAEEEEAIIIQQAPIREVESKKKSPCCASCKKKKLPPTETNIIFNDCCDDATKEDYKNMTLKKFKQTHPECCLPKLEIRKIASAPVTLVRETTSNHISEKSHTVTYIETVPSETNKSKDKGSTVGKKGCSKCCKAKAKNDPIYIFNDCCDSKTIDDFYTLGRMKFVKKYPECCWPRMLSRVENLPIETDFPPQSHEVITVKNEQKKSPNKTVKQEELVFGECCDEETKQQYYNLGAKKFKKIYPECCWPIMKQTETIVNDPVPTEPTVVLTKEGTVKTLQSTKSAVQLEYVFNDCCDDVVKEEFLKLGMKKFAKKYPNCCIPEHIERVVITEVEKPLTPVPSHHSSKPTIVQVTSVIQKKEIKQESKATKKCCTMCKKRKAKESKKNVKEIFEVLVDNKYTYIFNDCCDDIVREDFYKLGEDEFKKKYPECCWPRKELTCCDDDLDYWTNLLEYSKKHPSILDKLPECCWEHLKKIRTPDLDDRSELVMTHKLADRSEKSIVPLESPEMEPIRSNQSKLPIRKDEVTEVPVPVWVNKSVETTPTIAPTPSPPIAPSTTEPSHLPIAKVASPQTPKITSQPTPIHVEATPSIAPEVPSTSSPMPQTPVSKPVSTQIPTPIPTQVPTPDPTPDPTPAVTPKHSARTPSTVTQKPEKPSIITLKNESVDVTPTKKTTIAKIPSNHPPVRTEPIKSKETVPAPISKSSIIAPKPEPIPEIVVEQDHKPEHVFIPDPEPVIIREPEHEFMNEPEPKITPHPEPEYTPELKPIISNQPIPVNIPEPEVLPDPEPEEEPIVIPEPEPEPTPVESVSSIPFPESPVTPDSPVGSLQIPESIDHPQPCACKRKHTPSGNIVRIKSDYCLCKPGENMDPIKFRCLCKKYKLDLLKERICDDEFGICPCKKAVKPKSSNKSSINVRNDSVTLATIDLDPTPEHLSLHTSYSLLDQIDTFFGPQKPTSVPPVNLECAGVTSAQSPKVPRKVHINFKSLLPNVSKEPTKYIKAMNPFSKTSKPKTILKKESSIKSSDSAKKSVTLGHVFKQHQVLTIHSKIQVREDDDKFKSVDYEDKYTANRRSTRNTSMTPQDEKNIKFLEEMDVSNYDTSPTMPMRSSSDSELKIASSSQDLITSVELTDMLDTKSSDLLLTNKSEKTPSLLAIGNMESEPPISPRQSVKFQKEVPPPQVILPTTPPSPQSLSQSPPRLTTPSPNPKKKKGFIEWLKTNLRMDADDDNQSVKSTHSQKKSEVRSKHSGIAKPTRTFFSNKHRGAKCKNTKQPPQGAIHLRESHFKHAFQCGCSHASGRLCKCGGEISHCCHCKPKPTEQVVNYSFVDYSNVYSQNQQPVKLVKLKQTSYHSIFEMDQLSQEEGPAFYNNEDSCYGTVLDDILLDDRFSCDSEFDHEYTDELFDLNQNHTMGFSSQDRLSTIVERTEHEHDHESTLKEEDESVKNDVQEIMDIYNRLCRESSNDSSVDKSLGDRLPHVLIKREFNSNKRHQEIFNCALGNNVKLSATKGSGAVLEGKSSKLGRMLNAINKKMKLSFSKLKLKKTKKPNDVQSPLSTPPETSRRSLKKEIIRFTQTSKSPTTKKTAYGGDEGRKEEIRIGGTSYLIRAPRCTSKAENLNSQRTINSDIPSLKSYETSNETWKNHLDANNIDLSLSNSRLEVIKEMVKQSHRDQMFKMQREINWINQQIAGKYRESALKLLLDASQQVKEQLQNAIYHKAPTPGRSSTATLVKPHITEKSIEVVAQRPQLITRPAANTLPTFEIDNCDICYSVHGNNLKHDDQKDLEQFRETIRRERARIKREELLRKKEAFCEVIRRNPCFPEKEIDKTTSSNHDTCALFMGHTCSTCLINDTPTKDSNSKHLKQPSKSTHLYAQNVSSCSESVLTSIEENANILSSYVPENAPVYPVIVAPSITRLNTCDALQRNNLGSGLTDYKTLSYGQKPSDTSKSTVKQHERVRPHKLIGRERLNIVNLKRTQQNLQKYQDRSKYYRLVLKEETQDLSSGMQVQQQTAINKVLVPCDNYIVSQRPEMLLVQPGTSRTQSKSQSAVRSNKQRKLILKPSQVSEESHEKVKFRLKFQIPDSQNSALKNKSYMLEKLSTTSYPNNEKEYVLNVHDYAETSRTNHSSTSQRKIIMCASKNFPKRRSDLSKPRILVPSKCDQCPPNDIELNAAPHSRRRYRDDQFEVESYSGYDLHIPHTERIEHEHRNNPSSEPRTYLCKNKNRQYSNKHEQR